MRRHNYAADVLEPEQHEEFMLQNRVKSIKEAKEDYLGCMLGDGSLVRGRKKASFKISLSAGDYGRWEKEEDSTGLMPYLEFLKDSLSHLVEFPTTHPTWYKCRASKVTSESYLSGYFLTCLLQSVPSTILASEYKCWYRLITSEIRKSRNFPDNRKTYKLLRGSIEDNFSVRTLARWIEQDGSCSWRTHTGHPLVLCSVGFSKEENERLQSITWQQLNIMPRVTRYKDKWRLVFSQIDTYRVWGIVGEHLHPAFQYKAIGPESKEVQGMRRRIDTVRKSLSEPIGVTNAR